MPKVYIVGPMRGLPQLNFPAFDRAAMLGRTLGWTVLSPAEMDRTAFVDPVEAEATKDGHNLPLLREIARRDVEALLALKSEDGDAIALLPGWENSVGGRGEHALAEWLRLRVLDAQTFRPFDEPAVCYTCGDGACPSMADIVKQQAEHLANTPYCHSKTPRLGCCTVGGTTAVTKPSDGRQTYGSVMASPLPTMNVSYPGRRVSVQCARGRHWAGRNGSPSIIGTTREKSGAFYVAGAT